MIYDIVIIGGGVIGAMTARELSRYDLKLCLLEKENDVSMGTSKANSGIIHAGFDADYGTLKSKLNVAGTNMIESIAVELDVPFKRNGSIVIAFDDKETAHINKLKERGIKNGVTGLSILDYKHLKELEPNISNKAKYALYAPTAGIICPYELTIASIENAVSNGLDLKTNFCVKKILDEDNYFTICSEKDTVKSKYIVNASGLYADDIASMVGDEYSPINPRKGEYLLLDKKEGAVVNHTIFKVPSKFGKGVLVTPTVDGNLLLGPTSEIIMEKDDISTTDKGIENIVKNAVSLVPSINLKSVITSFAGIRACNDSNDFIIEKSRKSNKIIHVCGIQSPGLSSAPAIACYVVNLISDNGINLTPKPNFNPYRKPIYRFRHMKDSEKNDLIKKDNRYGKIICRCENITEGEIVDAIHRNPKALDFDSIKRRTRSGMGRCQGGFCTPQIIEIISRELDIPIEDVTKLGGHSNFIVGRTK